MYQPGSNSKNLIVSENVVCRIIHSMLFYKVLKTNALFIIYKWIYM